MQTPPQTDTERELPQFAQIIETYRTDMGLSKAQLLADYPELGTDKTYGKILKGDLTELNSEKWLAAYQHVKDVITSDAIFPDDPLLPNLLGPREACRVYLEARQDRGNSRFIPILGDTGTGKTSCINILLAKPYGLSTAVVIEASEIWRTKDGKGTAPHLLAELADKLGLKDLPSNKSRVEKIVITELCTRRRCVVVDEAHHLCPGGLNVLKRIINLSPTIVIATAMPTLWDRLTGHKGPAWNEARQLTGNRLAEVVTIQLHSADVLALVCARLSSVKALEPLITQVRERDPSAKLVPTVLDAMAETLKSEAPGFGNLKFVQRTLVRFRRDIAAGESPDAFGLAAAIKAEKKTRIKAA